jgi:hypothetical protein
MDTGLFIYVCDALFVITKIQTQNLMVLWWVAFNTTDLGKVSIWAFSTPRLINHIEKFSCHAKNPFE